MWKTLVVLTTMVVLGMGTGAHAALINGGFETGDLSGWTITAGDITRYGLGGTGSPPLPKEGDYFAWLTADVAPYTNLSQEIFLQAGDMLSGWAYYDRGIISDQEAYVAIYKDAMLVETPWHRSAAGSTEWEQWTFTAAEAGLYILYLGITESSGAVMHSMAYFDGNVHTPVPVPGALLLLGSGLAGLAAVGRKRFGR